MNNAAIGIKGTYLIGAYICFLALMLIVKTDWTWLNNLSRWLLLPLLILFYFINTGIDSKFEKNIFYGIVLFAMTPLLPIAQPVLGDYHFDLIVFLWIIAFFCYSRAIISITSGSSTILYRQKWLGIILLMGGLVALFFFLNSMGLSLGALVPWICLGLASLVLFLACFNLSGQISPLLHTFFMIGAILLIGYNSLVGLNINVNISIFEGKSSALFYLGHLMIIFGAVRSCVLFRNNDFSDIASVLIKKKN